MALAQRNPASKDTGVLQPRHHPQDHLLFFQLLLAAGPGVAAYQPGVILGLDNGPPAKPLPVPIRPATRLPVLLRQPEQCPLEVREIILPHALDQRRQGYPAFAQQTAKERLSNRTQPLAQRLRPLLLNQFPSFGRGYLSQPSLKSFLFAGHGDTPKPPGCGPGHWW